MKSFLGFGNGSSKQQAEIDSLRIQLTHAQTTNNQLTAQLESVQEQLRRREKQLTDEQAIIDTLRREKSKLSSTIERVQQTNDKSHTQLSESKRKAQEVTLAKNKLEVQLQHMSETKGLLKKQLKHKEDDLQELGKKNTQLNDNLLSVRRQTQEAKRHFERAEHEAKRKLQSSEET